MTSSATESELDIHVISGFKLLHLAALFLDELLDDEATNCVARVALACVRFDDDTTIHPWSVVLFVLGGVVWMNCMCDIRTD